MVLNQYEMIDIKKTRKRMLRIWDRFKADNLVLLFPMVDYTFLSPKYVAYFPLTNITRNIKTLSKMCGKLRKKC